MLSLPDSNEALLKGFWTLLSVGIGVGVGAVLGLAGAPAAGLWGLATAVGGAALGMRRPSLAVRPYATWNRVARGARRVARAWLTGVALLMLTVIGRLGSRIAMTSPDPMASGWIPKRLPDAASYPGMSDLPHPAPPSKAWARSYASWALRSGEMWAWSLLPVLVLLRWVEDRPRGSFGGNVYTLY